MMASARYEVEVTVGSARDLKNVNWRNGELKPYAVLWVDAGPKCSTRVDLDHGDNPVWDEKITVPLPPSARIQDAVLYIDVVHANAVQGVKPVVGSARLPLHDVVDDAGIGGRASRNLRLKRPSGRPHGRLDVRVAVKEPSRYYDPNPYPAPAYSTQPSTGSYGAPSRDPYAAGGYGAPAAAAGGYAAGAYGAPAAAGGGYGAGAYVAPAAAAGYAAGAYGAPAAAGGYVAAPPAGYPSTYGSTAPPQAAYGATPAYGATAPAATSAVDPKKKKMGMGTGLAVGAAAGVLGGLALAGGASLLENKFEEHVAERVEEESYGGGGYDDDDY